MSIFDGLGSYFFRPNLEDAACEAIGGWKSCLNCQILHFAFLFNLIKVLFSFEPWLRVQTIVSPAMKDVQTGETKLQLSLAIVLGLKL